MTELVLVRHGETVWHRDNRYAGRSDVALTDHGRRQAEVLGDWSATAGLDAVWVSPLSRARETAAPVARATGLDPHVDERIIELDFGRAEGLTAREMERDFPKARAAFVADPVTNYLPGGEDPALAVKRMASCAGDIVRAYPSGRVLVVGHSTAHRLLLCHLLGLPLRSYRRVFPVFRNCALTTVRWDGEGQAALLEFNTPVES